MFSSILSMSFLYIEMESSNCFCCCFKPLILSSNCCNLYFNSSLLSGAGVNILTNRKITAPIVKTNNISNSIILGKYKGEDLILKRGKFGLYVSWLTQTKSMAILGNRPIENIGLDEVLEILKKDEIQETSPVNTNIIRNVTDNISIRKGPKGNYIFFKTSKMKRPQFFKLDGFTEDICTCDTTLFKKWIFDTHHIV